MSTQTLNTNYGYGENDIIREVAVGKVAIQLFLTLIVKQLKISVEHVRVVTTLNIMKYIILYLM